LLQVYSLSIVLWRMWTRRDPFGKLRNPFELTARVAVQGLRPDIPPPSEMPPRLAKLLQAMWTHELRERPAIEEVWKAVADPATYELVAEDS
jgi:hypothetical protein